MKWFPTLLCLVGLQVTAFSQNAPLQSFDTFIGIWKAEGNWGDGSKFYQVTTFEYDLNGTLVLARAEGYTDQQQTTIGARNHGIRQYNPEEDKILFWEFDVFGGMTTGEVTFEGNNMFYSYAYGGSLLTDGWIKQADGSYEYIVGVRENGEWRQTYLRCPVIKQ